MQHVYTWGPGESAVSDTTTPVYVVTGASSGIGEAIATQLAGTGARVLIGARTTESGAAAASRIHSTVPDAEIDVVAGDLSEMTQVRSLAEQVRERTDRLDGLILNAAEIRPRLELTGDGLEAMFAANYLSGFLLTALLRPLLAASAPARVVTTTSAMHTRVKSVDLQGLATGADFEHTATYETTKLLAAVFAAELARRAHGIGITANAADPGFVRTNLARHASGAFRLFLTLTRPFQSPPSKAAATAVYLATAPQAETPTGGYYTKSRPGKPSPLARDPELGHQLWAQSTTLLTAADTATSDELTF